MKSLDFGGKIELNTWLITTVGAMQGHCFLNLKTTNEYVEHNSYVIPLSEHRLSSPYTAERAQNGGCAKRFKYV